MNQNSVEEEENNRNCVHVVSVCACVYVRCEQTYACMYACKCRLTRLSHSIHGTPVSGSPYIPKSRDAQVYKQSDSTCLDPPYTLCELNLLLATSSP